MAPAKKKPRCVIGPMLDTVVQETQLQSNNNSESHVDESNNTKSPSLEDSVDSDATKSPSDDSDEDRLRDRDNDDGVNGQGKIIILSCIQFILFDHFPIYIYYLFHCYSKKY